jgi:hypothetical protein
MINTIEWTGGKIAEPGIYHGVPIAEYHDDPCAGPSISSTGLRMIWSKSPAHYWCRSPYNADREPPEQNPAFDLGKAAHHYLLGEDAFSEHFVLSPYDDFRTKEAREWRLETWKSGKVVLTEAQMDQVRGMLRGLLRNSLVRDAGILDGLVERSLFWVDAETGIWLRARPDVIPTASGLFVDLKTTNSVSREDIARSIASYGYAMQAALLRIGCRALGLPFESFSLVFVEKDAPFCARVVVLKDHELDRGDRCVRAALRTFADCMASGDWPGPGDHGDAEWIESPVWSQTATDARLDEFERARNIRSEAAE